jgi:hypothetical protein
VGNPWVRTCRHLGWGISDEGMGLSEVPAVVEKDDEGLASEMLEESGVSWMKVSA